MVTQKWTLHKLVHKFALWLSPWTQSTTKQASAILVVFPWQPIEICTGLWCRCWLQWFLKKNFFLLFFLACWPTFFFSPLSRNWNSFIYNFLSNAQFYQSQDLCRMPTDEFRRTAAFIFAFFINYFRACYLTYFVMVAVGFKQLCLSHVEFENLSCENRNTNKKKDTGC